MARDFQTFLNQLEANGELKRVGAEVDPHLEAGAIADRVAKQPGGGCALRFDRIKGASMPVAMNVFGSRRRMAMALGVDQDPAGLDAVAARIEKLIQEVMPKPGSSLLDKLAKLPMLAEIGGWMPKTVGKGICQEVIWRGADARLSRLPVLTTWPEDGGPFITLGLGHTALPGRPPEHGPVPAPGLRRAHPGLPHPAAPRRRPGPPRLRARATGCRWR